MKVYYLEYDSMMTIFAVVSKKRTNFSNNNIVCVRSYDFEPRMGKLNRVHYQDIPEDGILDIRNARKVWNRCIDYAVTENHELKMSESIYKTTDDREIMMDSDVCKAMTEIATKAVIGAHQGK